MGLQLAQSNRREQDGKLKVKQHALLGVGKRKRTLEK